MSRESPRAKIGRQTGCEKELPEVSSRRPQCFVQARRLAGVDVLSTGGPNIYRLAVAELDGKPDAERDRRLDLRQPRVRVHRRREAPVGCADRRVCVRSGRGRPGRRRARRDRGRRRGRLVYICSARRQAALETRSRRAGVSGGHREARWQIAGGAGQRRDARTGRASPRRASGWRRRSSTARDE